MSDNLETPAPGPQPEGDLPADFFEGATETTPAVHRAAAEARAVPPRPSFAPALAEPSRHPVFPMVIGFAFLAAIVASIAVTWQTPPVSAAASPTPGAAPASAPEPAANDESAKALAARVETLKAEHDELTKQITALQAKIEALPKPAPPPDLEPIHTKLGDLAKTSQAVAPLPKQVEAIDARVGATNKTLQALQARVDGLSETVKKVVAPAAGAPKPDAPTPKPEDVNVEGQSFGQAVELFKAGKYKEANTLLKTTEDNDPKDARVWYYAAMASGMTANLWTDAEKLVAKGVAREKAGTPPAAEIDAEFAKLSPKLKTWLDSYRKKAKK